MAGVSENYSKIEVCSVVRFLQAEGVNRMDTYPIYIDGCLTTDAFAGFCLLICLTDSNELFFVVIFVLSYLLVSLVPY
jgi:hypothetical protein